MSSGFGGAMGGAIPGAGAGFLAGGPLGALLGGLGGAGAGYLGGELGSLPGAKNFLFGKKERTKRIQRFSPEQQDIMNRLLSLGMQNFDPTAVENRARQQFQTQTAPSLAERFTSMGPAGSQGGQRSSAFMPAMFGAGADLESQLAALRYGLGGQQLGFGLQPQFESIYQPSRPGALESGGQQLMSLLPLLMMIGLRRNYGTDLR